MRNESGVELLSNICRHRQATMLEGRGSALFKQGIEEVGPYQSPTEDGMLHFHGFLRRNFEPHLE